MAAITGIALDRTQNRRFLVATSEREGSRDTVWRAREKMTTAPPQSGQRWRTTVAALTADRTSNHRSVARKLAVIL